MNLPAIFMDFLWPLITQNIYKILFTRPTIKAMLPIHIFFHHNKTYNQSKVTY